MVDGDDRPALVLQRLQHRDDRLFGGPRRHPRRARREDRGRRPGRARGRERNQPAAAGRPRGWAIWRSAKSVMPTRESASAAFARWRGLKRPRSPTSRLKNPSPRHRPPASGSPSRRWRAGERRRCGRAPRPPAGRMRWPLPASAGLETERGLQKGRLAGTVGTDDCRHRALRHIHVDRGRRRVSVS